MDANVETLDSDCEVMKKSGRGGRREGAGRKPTGKKRGGAHRERPAHDPQFPQHVTMRVVPRFLRLREPRFFEALRGVLVRYYETDFRICHVSLQHNHLHNEIEADTADAFEGGMRSYMVNLARAFNAAHGNRVGQVFEERYHSRPIKTARDARNTTAYVLCNWRRHREDFYDGASRAAALDEYSSAVSFRGWTQRFVIPADYRPLPVSQPRTSVLVTEWLKYGLIDPYERPGKWW
jgi:REP element-mobilizing transposase RayT